MTAELQRARQVADAVLYEGYLLYPYTSSALKNQARWQFGVLMPHGYADPSEPCGMETHVLASAQHGARVEIVARFLHATDPPCERETSLNVDVRPGESEGTFQFGDMRGTVRCTVTPDGEYYRLAVQLENDTQIEPASDRSRALAHALIGAHVVMAIENGRFLSLLDPPDGAADAASRCANRRVFPVLAGSPQDDGHAASLVLASPIILYDFPSVASQSTGHTFDSTEVDELLMLSVAAMTDEEKREARATDPRAAAIVDRADALTERAQMRLHGTFRPGDRVRVQPKRRADAFDIFAAGKTARVKSVAEDVDGRQYVAVIFDDDPASDLHEWYGRSFFYDPDEVESLGEGA